MIPVEDDQVLFNSTLRYIRLATHLVKICRFFRILWNFMGE
jgi:hypothetical protein